MLVLQLIIAYSMFWRKRVPRDTNMMELGVKRKSCGSCEGCTRLDCGICKCYMDKPKFGELGKRKQFCELKNADTFKKSSPKSPITQSEVSKEPSVPTVMSIDTFLLYSGRKIHNRNCMFKLFCLCSLVTRTTIYFEEPCVT